MEASHRFLSRNYLAAGFPFTASSRTPHVPAEGSSSRSSRTALPDGSSKSLRPSLVFTGIGYADMLTCISLDSATSSRGSEKTWAVRDSAVFTAEEALALGLAGSVMYECK